MYEKLISRALPGLLLLLLDDSGSMGDPLPGTNDSKFAWVERLFANILQLLLERSTEADGRVKARYYMHGVLYGSAPQVWGSGLMDIEAAVEHFTQNGNSLGLGGKLGGTDGRAGAQMVHDFLSEALAGEQFSESFPPMVFHLTDGMSRTDPSEVAEKIKQLSAADGNVLMVNAFIGTQTSLSYNGPEDFPGYLDAAEAGPSNDNITMFDMSSVVPESIRQYLVEERIFPKLREGARLFFDVRTKDMLKNTIQVMGSLGSQAERQVR